MRFIFLLVTGGLIGLLNANGMAMGNFPGSKNCADKTPYFAFCSHSLHNLEGWYGPCRATREEGQSDANKHVTKEHNGNSRWTGVLHAKSKSY
jgi:hypothetical protein